MSTFDLSSYLNSKNDFTQSGIPERTEVVPFPGMVGKLPAPDELSKTEALIEARKNKEFELKESQLAKQNKLRQESEKSLIGRLGLEYDSTLGAGLNAIAGGASDVSRMLGEGFAAIPSLGAQSLEQNIDPKSMDILKRKSAGAKITPEEEQWINTPIADIYDPSVLNGPTPQQMFDGKFGFERTRKFANEMRDATDISSIVNNEAIGRMAIEQSENKPLQEALKRLATPDITSWKKEDLTLAIKSVFESGANNPLAVTQAIAQNLPSLALAIVSPQALIAANVGYAQTNYDKWSENFAKRENREPTEQEKKEAQANAFSLAAAETAGDLLTAGAAKTLKGSLGFGSKAAGAVTPQALKEALGVVGKTAVGQAVSKVAPAVANATKAATKVLGAMGAEFGTEGYQTSTEQLLEKGKRADAEEVFFGGSLGALSSGGITSAAAGLGLAADAIDVATASQKQTAEDKKAKDAVFKSAVETGDVSSFVSDKNVLKNNWVNAAQALVENSKLENKTEEDIKNNINKIDEELIFDLEDKIQVLSLDTDKKVEILNGFIKDKQEELNADPTNEKLKQSIDALIAQRDAPLDSKKKSASNKIISKLQQQLNEVVNLREGLAAQTVVGEASVLNDAKAITQASTTDSTDGIATPAINVSGFVARAMKVRGPKTQEMADALTAVADSGKATPEEVNTLRILAAEIVASNKAKNAKGVSNDVLNGTGPKAGTAPRPGRDFMGVFTYQKKFDEATAKNNKEEANKNFNNLKAFTENHKAKLASFKSLKLGQMAVVNKQGNWIITSTDKFNSEKNALEFAKNNGGFAYVGPNPKNLIASIEDEISIMEPVLAKMALELGKQVKPKEEVSVAQTVETKQAEEKEPKISKPTEAVGRTEQESTTTVKPKEKVKPKEPTEKEKAEKTIKNAEKETAKIIRKKIGGSLYSKLRGVMSKAVLSNAVGKDKFGNVPIAYRGLSSKTGGDIDGLLADGSLDEWLKVKHDDPSFDESVAREYIFERVANGDYLTEESKLLLAQIDYSRQEAETYLQGILDEEIRRAEEEQRRLSEETTRNSTSTTSTNVVGNKGSTEISTGTIQTGVKEQADAEIVKSTENEKLINETETDLSQDEAESVAETTAQSESKAISDDTPGNGAGVNTDSDKLNEQESTIVEDKKYTSKQEVLKAIKKKKEAFVNFINCL